jgi:hypothetical protein
VSLAGTGATLLGVLGPARALPALLAVTLLVLVLVLTGAPSGPPSASAATCSDYATQAAAQAARDTRDADGDGRYCEDLPCPCAGPTDPGSGSGSPEPSPAPTKPTPPAGTSADPNNCRINRKIVRVGLSRTKYPEVRAHWERAIRKGWPRTLTIHRKGAERRRSRLLAGMPTRPGEDRDEYPPASARTTVKADVEYVDSAQNRGAGSVQGIKLKRYCSGQRFTFVWY